MENTLKALQLKSELDQLRPINKEQEDRIMQKFRLDWNYHSNHLEGNSLTYGETKALILHGITAQGKTLKDHFEITGHNEAINWVIDMVTGERPLTENFIRELHTLLLKESYEVDAQTADGKPTKKRISIGSYKTTANHVLTKTGEMFYFATPEETPAEMNDLLTWYDSKSKEKDVNPILLAAQFHYKFIRIHPFDDGNGRTARILMNFILMKFGFPPCIIKSDKESKDEYFAVLQLADAGNIEAFIEFIAKNVNRSLEIMIAGANGENIEEDDDLDKEIALLEQRLNNSGEETEKVRSITHINDIYINTIKNIASKIEIKLQKFDKHFLNKKIYTYFNHNANQYNNPESILYYVDEIFLNVDYNILKKKEQDNFFFNYRLKFNFNSLNYTIKSDNSEKIILKKYYENLTSSEIDIVVKMVIKKYLEEINSFLERK